MAVPKDLKDALRKREIRKSLPDALQGQLRHCVEGLGILSFWFIAIMHGPSNQPLRDFVYGMMYGSVAKPWQGAMALQAVLFWGLREFSKKVQLSEQF